MRKLSPESTKWSVSQFLIGLASVKTDHFYRGLAPMALQNALSHRVFPLSPGRGADLGPHDTPQECSLSRSLESLEDL